MSQMPDKIWLHKDTKYSTGDIVCGYQYEFVEGIEDEGGIKNFVEYVPKDTFIEKACEWLRENKDKYLYNTGVKGEYIPTCSGKMIDEFRKYMKGE